VLITIDTLRADRLNAYGYERGRTPAISALAADGVLFENVIVQTPITLPSHTTLLTGTYPVYHGVQDVVGRLREGVPTLAQWFKQRGYSTGAFVGSSVLSSVWGLSRGFDVYDDRFPNQGLRQVDFDRLERPAEEVVSAALEWLEKNRARPVFLWIHLYDPHDPYNPPAPFDTDFKDRPYDGEIAYTDAALARLFGALKKHQIYDKSLVVLTADHGESLGEHKEAYHGYYVYDASLRVPLIVKPAGGQAPGRKGTRVANQVRGIDIAPTIVQLLGEAVPSTMQGEALVAMMTGKRPNADLPAYAETLYPRIHFNWSPLFSYSTRDFKYIDAPIAELYDLRKDPGELTNIVSDNQVLANRMKEELRALQRRYVPRAVGQASRVGQASSLSAADNVDPETLERLKSLGYVGFSSGGSAAGAGKQLPDPKLKIAIYNQMNRAIELSRRGRIPMAITILEQVAQREPTMPVVHFLLGSEYLAQGQSLRAVEAFRETLRHNPGSNVARFNLARAYSQASLPDRAEQTAREVLDKEPRHFPARHLLATLLARRSKFQEAVTEELKALEVRPTFADGHGNLGSYYLSLGQLDRAVASYRKALEFAPGHLVAKINLSLAYLKLGQNELAIEQARGAIERDPRSALGHFYLGQAYLAKGQKEEARKAFVKAVELDPKLKPPAI